MKMSTKKIISILLVALMLMSTAPMSVFAAETGANPTVKIVSFMRGDVDDLRSSELLEVQVEGYDGNPRELTYKWTSSLGTYLYIYNSHNMYGINNTYGEYEIYNTDKDIERSSNVEEDRSGDKTLKLEGFMWAAVYGAYSSNKVSTALKGTVKVEVFDKNGNSLGSDSFSSFKAHNLDADIDNVVIGLFVGEEVNALDLLGRSGVVHITCTASSVTKAALTKDSQKDVIQITTKDGDYYITGKSAGQVQIDISIKKDNCKFHRNTSGTAQPIVYVFKKPTTTTTTTTLIINKDSVDERCEYFIDGNKGEKQPDGTVVFTGLTPNTNYTVEARAEYDDNGETKYVYSYVDDITKPVYKATVNTYLDNTLTDISDIHGEDVTLYLHEDKEGAGYVELIKNSTGVYTAEVLNGIYYPWHIEAGDHEHMAREYKLIIENANGSLNLHHYSVNYNTNGGTFKTGEEVCTEIYASASTVNATSNIPVRDGYAFAGWEYNGKIYRAGEKITSAISAPITLTAKWEKEVNVTINVTIDHKVDGGFDSNVNKDELVVNFLEMVAGTDAFIETGDKIYFSKESITDENGNSMPFAHSADSTAEGDLLTRYEATAPTYTGLLETSVFGVAVSKSGYDVGTIEKIKDENGNWTINIPLEYNPDDFDLKFSVEMAEDVPTELYPDAVIVKIACWDAEAGEWVIITQQRTTDKTVRPGVRVDIDPVTGKGSGSYPVWKHMSDNTPYGYRAVVAGFIYDGSTIIVPTERDHTKEDGLVIVTYTDGNYTATMDDVADGKKFSTSLYGAYYNDVTDAQQGTLHGVISVEKYNVTFDAQGGTINDKATDTLTGQYYVPDLTLDAYKPVMENHNFLGWYLDKECTVPAVSKELLVEDITLYAKWDKILTGELIVDGYYKDGEDQMPIDKADRATHALIELKEIIGDEEYNIAGQTVEIEWVTDQHFSDPVAYEFKGLDPDKTYRIDVYLVNYEAAYQNSTTVINGNGDIHDDYNENDYMAVYTEESKLETFVNTFLHFVPEEYIQNVVVDSTRIGESFRPKNALVKYYSQEIGIPNDPVIIVQHKGDGNGVNVNIDSTTGINDKAYGEKVWKKNYNGNIYDYQAELASLNGSNVEDWPISVIYGDAARWSPYNQAPTGDLSVTLVPRRYAIIYDWNDGSGHREFASYDHTWSHETTISEEENKYITREGYIFDGWYSNPECKGEAVTKIAADVAADTVLYAKWVPGIYEYTVNYLEYGTDKVLADAKTGEAEYATDIAENAIAVKGYNLVGDSAKTITIDTENNVINFYYAIGSYGYTVNYLEKDTNKALADAKTDIGEYKAEVTENAIAIKGYSLVGDSAKTITIDTENNVINFYYTINYYNYTVNYLEYGTDKVLADAKTGEAEYATDIAENAIAVKGYNLVGDSAKTITIDTENNVINFYYAIGSYGYTVNYLEKDTNKALADAKTDIGEYKAEVTEDAIAIKGYSLVGDSAKTITIDIENNVINFYYTINYYNYTVNYLEEGTDVVLRAPKTLGANYGTTVTANAEAIGGYILVGDATKSLTIDTENNVINFYYNADKVGGGDKGDEGDNIPDKYQKKITFKVINGTFQDGTIEKVVYMTRTTGGEWNAENGIVVVEFPQGKANYGYENGQWYNENGETVVGFEDRILTGPEDAEFTLIYVEKPKYTVSYKYEGEVPENYIAPEGATYYKGTAVAVEKAPVAPEGYTFTGWSKDGAFVLNSDVVIVGTWIKNSYLVKYEYKNAPAGAPTVPGETSYKFGADVKVADAPTLEGYTFTGWTTTNVTVVDGGFTMPAHEVVLQGEWIKLPGEPDVPGGEDPEVPDTPDIPDTPEVPDTPVDPDTPDVEGDGSISGGAHHILFGKTDGIGWYQVSQDGGQTWDIVFGNSTYEVEHGTEIIIKANDIMGDAFSFYVNGEKYRPDENNSITLTVDGYMLIGAVGIDPDVDFEVPDVEESLNWFQRIIKAIKDFFAKLFGKK